MFLKVFTTFSRDACTSVLLNINKFYFLFGSAEGTQRLSRFKGIKDHLDIFLPYYTHATIGGITGTLLTLRDQANATKKEMSITIHSASHNIPFISPISTFINPVTDHIMLNPLPMPTDKIYKLDIASESSSVYQIPLKSDKSDEYTVSYVIEKRGKKKTDKAKLDKFGLKGKEIAQLQKEGKITKDGNVITIDMIMCDSCEKNKLTILLFLPSIQYIPSLVMSAVKTYLSSESELGLVYISAPQEVLLHSEFISYIKLLSPCSKIALDCFEMNTSTKIKSIELINAFKLILPDYFTLAPNPLFTMEAKKMIIDIYQSFSKSPVTLPQEGSIFTIAKDSIIYEPEKNKFDISKIKAQLSTQIISVAPVVKTPINFANNPKLVFLGTASQKPSQLRNVSSILLLSNNMNGMLLDVGENTYGQLLDHYGEAVDKILSNIKIIFISHSHGDHNLGVGRILVEIDKAQKKYGVVGPIYLVCGNYMMPFVKFFIEKYGLTKVKCINVINLNPSHHKEIHSTPIEIKTKMHTKCIAKLYKTKSDDLIELFDTSLKNFGIKQIYCVEVNHISDSHALSISSDEWSIVYTGDTTTCANLCNFISKPTLLIHENTDGDEDEAKAIASKHSNNKIAYSHMDKIQPQYTIFTHFSQRYSPSLPQLPPSPHKVICAFDHMELQMSDLEYLSKTTPTMEAASLVLDEYLDSKNDE